ncbi:hypothetical protein GIB67_007290 [Kingdonia uniflora]|uniref:Uncharacterized protein n=1 Tax=Kingdonia uniflora TaxID=39325 RepID=A0A7J7NX87_9MAGN|nr:hypothetical protein GIB67_007290 [Kingdonia uniflora]
MFVLGFLVFSGGIKGFQVSDGFGCVIGLVGLGLGFGVLLYLVVNWVLACVVVVVELSWGYAPLRRSAVLVKESRGVGVSLVLFYGGFMGLMVWASFGLKLGSGVWGEVLFVVQTVLLSSCLTGLLLHSMASVTVFYMYCKALHGELAFEIAEEFSREYVSLPFDEEKNEVPPDPDPDDTAGHEGFIGQLDRVAETRETIAGKMTGSGLTGRRDEVYWTSKLDISSEILGEIKDRVATVPGFSREREAVREREQRRAYPVQPDAPKATSPHSRDKHVFYFSPTQTRFKTRPEPKPNLEPNPSDPSGAQGSQLPKLFHSIQIPLQTRKKWCLSWV